MLLSLFLTSFVSATLWPLASEAVFIYLMHQHPEQLPALLLTASLGNSLGAILMYELGLMSHSRLDQLLKKKQPHMLKTKATIARFGTPVLVLAWVPIVGDLLPIAAGLLSIRRLSAWFWISLGKSARYSVLAYTVYLLNPIVT